MRTVPYTKHIHSVRPTALPRIMAHVHSVQRITCRDGCKRPWKSPPAPAPASPLPPPLPSSRPNGPRDLRFGKGNPIEKKKKPPLDVRDLHVFCLVCPVTVSRILFPFPPGTRTRPGLHRNGTGQDRVGCDGVSVTGEEGSKNRKRKSKAKQSKKKGTKKKKKGQVRHFPHLHDLVAM